MSYDVFISYRWGDPDEFQATLINQILREAGYVVAFDKYEFQPHQTAFDEMARCIVESRWTLALLSPRYLESFNTREEAVMQKVLDHKERKRKIVPLFLSECEAPLWLASLVGIRWYLSDPDPLERLLETLSADSSPFDGLTTDDEKRARINEQKKRIPSQYKTAVAIGIGAGGGVAASVAAKRMSAIRRGPTEDKADSLDEIVDGAEETAEDVVEEGGSLALDILDWLT